MMIPEFRSIIERPLDIIKHESASNEVIKGIRVGFQRCSLESIALISMRSPIPICPWHWIMLEREDTFPFKRFNAYCNCQACQAMTAYDTDVKKLSSCQNQYVLMPALLRESFMNGTETWTFHLEEVPTSCACSVKLTRQK